MRFLQAIVLCAVSAGNQQSPWFIPTNAERCKQKGNVHNKQWIFCLLLEGSTKDVHNFNWRINYCFFFFLKLANDSNNITALRRPRPGADLQIVLCLINLLSYPLPPMALCCCQAQTVWNGVSVDKIGYVVRDKDILNLKEYQSYIIGLKVKVMGEFGRMW